MKKVEVIIKNRNTLVLEEPAEKGDYIDLTTISNIDFSQIEAAIADGKDHIYKEKLEEFKKKVEIQKQLAIQEEEKKHIQETLELKAIIEELKKDKENSLRILETDLKQKSQKEIWELKESIKRFEADKEKALELQKITLTSEFDKKSSELLSTIDKYDLNKKVEIEALKAQQLLEIQKLNSQIQAIIEENKITINQLTQNNELDKKNAELEQQKQIQAMKEEYMKELGEKDTIIFNLQRQKAALHTKQTGEDLEAWCNNEVLSYMQNGLRNCTWEKDNQAIKEDGDKHGTKADYIFKVYATEKHLPQEELASICLDMKDENPDSKNKKPNSYHYKTLNENRVKKHCKYAVLVSNLETDKPNDIPIFKANEYTDMYVVRPGYLMTFLNMIASLTTRFAELILMDEKERLEVLTIQQFEESFEAIKNTYLEKPLIALKNKVSSIKDKSSSIIKAAKDIDEFCDSIIKEYIQKIETKLNSFTITYQKENKKFDKQKAMIQQES